MKKTLTLVLIALVIPALTAYRNYPETDTREINRTIPLKPGTASLRVDNVFGPITVTGESRSDVVLRALEIRRARDTESLQRAREETRLAVSTGGDELKIIADGPFRTGDDRIRWNRDLGYTVRYDLELRIPRDINLTLKTVCEGDIEVRGLVGSFDVSNVNGAVRMTGINGSGRAGTVNGELKVRFTANPAADCRFRTINGTVNLHFQNPLSAELRLKTMHGRMLSDFPFEYLPVRRETATEGSGPLVCRFDGYQPVRIGEGGPVYTISTLNGNININSNKK